MEHAATPQPGGCVIRRMVKCYPNGRTCVLEGDRGAGRALLVDLNAGSARLLFADDHAAGLFRYRRPLVLQTDISVGGQPLRDIPCRMSWKQGAEIGLEFDQRMDFGLLDLQAALDGNDAA